MLIRLTAASLNYRDILISSRSRDYPGIDGLPGNHKPNLVPCPDGAGVIHAVGPDSKWFGREGMNIILHPSEWLSGDVRNFDLNKEFGSRALDGASSTFIPHSNDREFT